MAATFDDDALYETFTMVSDEARAKYHQYQKNKEYDRYKGLTFGRRISISSVIPAGAVAWKPMEKIRT